MCFPDVTALIFCVALSGYNLKCAEDNETNRLLEDIQLFGEIVNSKWFVNTPIILFLNKSDLFKLKIEQKINIDIAFPEFNGDLDFDICIDFITNECIKLVKNTEKDIYVHTTCATNTNNIEAVWEATHDIIFGQNIIAAGF